MNPPHELRPPPSSSCSSSMGESSSEDEDEDEERERSSACDSVSVKPTQTTSDALVTRLLLLPDGTVLADNLTPAMAELLHQLNLGTDPSTQCSLHLGSSEPPCPPELRNALEHGLASGPRVSVGATTCANPARASKDES